MKDEPVKFKNRRISDVHPFYSRINMSRFKCNITIKARALSALSGYTRYICEREYRKLKYKMEKAKPIS
jgi:hypothetical protein